MAHFNFQLAKWDSGNRFTLTTDLEFGLFIFICSKNNFTHK